MCAAGRCRPAPTARSGTGRGPEGPPRAWACRRLFGYRLCVRLGRAGWCLDPQKGGLPLVTFSLLPDSRHSQWAWRGMISVILLKITGGITQLQSCAEEESGTSGAPGARARAGRCMGSPATDPSPTPTPRPRAELFPGSNCSEQCCLKRADGSPELGGGRCKATSPPASPQLPTPEPGPAGSWPALRPPRGSGPGTAPGRSR